MIELIFGKIRPPHSRMGDLLLTVSWMPNATVKTLANQLSLVISPTNAGLFSRILNHQKYAVLSFGEVNEQGKGHLYIYLYIYIDII